MVFCGDKHLLRTAKLGDLIEEYGRRACIKEIWRNFPDWLSFSLLLLFFSSSVHTSSVLSLLCLFYVLPFRSFPFILGTEGSDDGCRGLLELLISNRAFRFILTCWKFLIQLNWSCPFVYKRRRLALGSSHKPTPRLAFCCQHETVSGEGWKRSQNGQKKKPVVAWRNEQKNNEGKEGEHQSGKILIYS